MIRYILVLLGSDSYNDLSVWGKLEVYLHGCPWGKPKLVTSFSQLFLDEPLQGQHVFIGKIFLTFFWMLFFVLLD